MRMVTFACLAITLFLFGCEKNGGSSRSQLQNWLFDETHLKVLCTTEMIGDLVTYIGGERITALTLIVGQLDPHTYELVKGDDEKMTAADIIFYNGLGLEHGPSLHHHLQNNPKAVAIGDAIMRQNEDAILTIEGQLDPHIWLDVSLWAEAIWPIRERLAEVDPEHAYEYEQRAQNLYDRLLKAHDEAYETLQAVPSEKRYLVTSHDAFNYFTRAYLALPEETTYAEWKPRFAAPEGLAPEGQLGAADIRLIIDHLQRYDIHVIFPESNVSKDSIRKIVDAAEEKGHKVWIAKSELYGDAMGEKGSEGGEYPGMVLWNAKTIACYLTEECLEVAP